MPLNASYPRWYCTFRGFVIGLAIGSVVTIHLYELKIVPLSNPVWQQVFFPIFVYGLPWFILALFETFFGIRRYRTLQRAMAGRSATGQKGL